MKKEISYKLPSIIAYLRECYRSDNRENAIFNVFDKKVEFVTFIEKKDNLLNGLLPGISLAHPQLAEVAKKAELQKREKGLYLGAFFIVGHLSHTEETQNICGPIWLGPARVSLEKNVPMVAADLSRMQINLPLLNLLASEEERDINSESMVGKFPQLPLNQKKIMNLVTTLERLVPLLEMDGVLQYPEQVGGKELKKHLKKRGDSLTLLPAGALLLVKHSVETRGVLFELEKMKKSTTFSAPLYRLFAGSGRHPQLGTPGRLKGVKHHVPIILSNPQKQVLSNAAGETLNLAIGPPGTGKSITIAAIALDHLSRGETVLIASKTNQAVDVVGEKIESILGVNQFVLRGGRKKYLKDLKHFVDNLLYGIIPLPDMSWEIHGELLIEQSGLEKELKELEETLANRSTLEQEWGKQTTQPPLTGIKRWIQNHKLNSIEKTIKVQPPYWELLFSYQQKMSRYLRISRLLLQKEIRHFIQSVIDRKRKDLKLLVKAFKAFESSRQESLFAQMDLREILKAFPVWLVNQSDISQVLPMIEELFDVVLIDEATQCDMASSLPILHRGKRAVIVGDPHQLRHISFLSRDRQQHIARECGLDDREWTAYNYRDSSLLDLVSDRIEKQKNVVFLDEHFRSLPPIIQFSNREFYGNCLKVMQARPTSHKSQCLRFVRIDGKRDTAGINKQEIEQILDKIEHITGEQSGDDSKSPNTIGIVSPFTAQADYIFKRVLKRFSWTTIERHRVLVGTPYAFQGEEREMVFISLCLDNQSHPAAFRYLNRPDVFNVAVTRARNYQVIYCSFNARDAKVKGLLRRYLEFIDNYEKSRVESHDPHHDPFLQEVREVLLQKDWECWPYFPVAGFYVDLVARRHSIFCGIDLIGYPGVYSAAFELERTRIFNRAGFPIFPLTYRSWKNNPIQVIESLEEWATSLSQATDNMLTGTELNALKRP